MGTFFVLPLSLNATARRNDESMAEGAKRRFRRRGGAKKNKNKNKIASETNVDSIPQLDAVDVDTPDQYSRNGRDFTTNSFSASLHSALDTDLSSYLEQLQRDLERVQREEADGGAYGEDETEERPAMLLARNGLQSLRPQLHEVSMDSVGSRIIESLIRAVSDDADTIAETLTSIFNLGSRRVTALALHRCGSHVLQTLADIISVANINIVRSGLVMQAIEGICKVIDEWTVEEFSEVIYNPCGSHVFRSLIACISGLPVDEPKEQKLDDLMGSQRVPSYLEHAVAVPEEWLETAGRLSQKLIDSSSKELLSNLIWHPASCAAYQSLLSAVTQYDRELAKELVSKSFNGCSVLDTCFDTHGARYVERIVVCLGTSYVLPHLKGNLARMSSDSKANYVVQRILLSLRGRGAVMSAWDELEPELPKMVAFGSSRDGVVLAMIRAAEIEGDEQVRRRAARSIAKTVGAVGSNARFLCGILITGTIDRWQRWREGVKDWAESGMGIQLNRKVEEEEECVLQLPGGMPGISLLGVLKARSLLRYPGGPGQVARDSMANLSSTEVLALSTHPTGSRLIEQWMSADEELGTNKAYQAHISYALELGESGIGVAALSRNPYGAQILIKAVPRAPEHVRKLAMDALAARVASLRDHQFGRQVVRKCRVDEYIRRTNDWSATESARDKRHRLFSDILTVNDNSKDGLQMSCNDGKRRKKRKDLDLSGTSQPPSGQSVVDSTRKKPTSEIPRKEQMASRKHKTVDVDKTNSSVSGLENVLQAISDAAQVTTQSKKKRKKST